MTFRRLLAMAAEDGVAIHGEEYGFDGKRYAWASLRWPGGDYAKPTGRVLMEEGANLDECAARLAARYGGRDA